MKLAYENAVKATQAAEARLKALKSGSPSDRATGAQIDAAKASEAAAQARLDQLIAERDGKATDSFEAAIQQAQAAIDSARSRWRRPNSARRLPARSRSSTSRPANSRRAINPP